ncbi:ABC transporter substrate-binding protein [Aliihoeflea sp. PC F10.4]
MSRIELNEKLSILSQAAKEGTISRRQFMIRTSVLLAAGAAGLPAGAFAQAAEPQRGGFARFGLQSASQNDTMDPGSWATAFTGAAFNGSLCNNLTEILPDGSLAGDLAESWEPSDGAKRWVLQIRNGITFHDGKSLTPEDVRQSLLHHMGEGSTSGAKAIVSQIEDVAVDGSDKIVLTLHAGNADLPYLLADYHLSIFPAREDGNGIDWQRGVGTGSFTLENFEPGIAIRLKRNPNYHKNNKPYLDEVEFIGIPDATARLNALLTGEVEMISDVDVRNVPLVERSGLAKVQRIPSLRHFSFDMNASIAPFDNLDARMALKYALDREDVIRKVYLGDAKSGNDQPVAEIMEYYRDPTPRYAYDVAKAKEHLAKAGLDSLNVDLSVSEVAFPGAVDAAVLFKEHAAAAGININVVREANDGYWENVWRKKPFHGVEWYGRATCDWLFSTVFASDGAWNNTGWSNARFDDLLAAAKAETDPAVRAEQYGEMQQLIHDDGGMILVAFANYRNAVSNKLQYGEVGGITPMDNMRMTERWWMTQ